MSNEKQSRTIQASKRTLQIFQELIDRDGGRVTEIADELGYSKGMVHNHLATLEAEQWIKQDGRIYRPSFLMMNVAEKIKHNSDLYWASHQRIDQLAEETQLYAQLMIEEFGKGYYIHTKAAQGTAREYHTKKSEKPSHLHLTSTGQAILAFLSEDRIETIIQRHGLPAETIHTITDREELFDKTKQIRENGYSLSDQEKLRGTRAVGVPILDKEDRVLGAISVSGPVSEIPDQRFENELPDQVIETKRLIELELDISGLG